MKKLFLITIFASLLVIDTLGQRTRSNSISRPCPASSAKAYAEIQRDGDLDLVPCSGRSVLVNGVAPSSVFSVSGTSRTNFFPFFSTETNFAKSPFSWNGTTFVFNNTALNSGFRMEFTPSTLGTGATIGCIAGCVSVLNIDPVNDAATLNADTTISIGGSADTINFGNGQQSIQTNAGTNIVMGAAFGGGNGSTFSIEDSTRDFVFATTNGTGLLDTSGIGTFFYQRTITAGGTTGNQTINKPVGTVNFAAGTGTGGLTVTNSTVDTGSIIIAIPRTNDATCAVKNVVPAAGSFVIRMTANCTAETSVGFLVLN